MRPSSKRPLSIQIHYSLLSLLLFTSFLVAPAHVLAASGYTDYQVTRALREMEAQDSSRLINVPGRGQVQYYAQTNPLWAQMRYEAQGSRHHRRFGAGGCAPTCAAMAIANLLPAEALGQIASYASGKAGGFGISTGIVNPLNMLSTDGALWINTAEDYLRYLPLVFGQYAAGNNPKRTNWRLGSTELSGTGGTSLGFLPELCDIYGLTYTKLAGKGRLEWMDSVRNGAVAIALANSQHQPFVNSSGHYVVIIGCDEEYLYLLDPQDKSDDEYQRDRRKILDVMERGLVRVALENFNHLHFAVIHVISPETSNELQ